MPRADDVTGWRAESECLTTIGQGDGVVRRKKRVLRHPDFERGPPTHYYLDQMMLIFNVLMGIGVFIIV